MQYPVFQVSTIARHIQATHPLRITSENVCLHVLSAFNTRETFSIVDDSTMQLVSSAYCANIYIQIEFALNHLHIEGTGWGLILNHAECHTPNLQRKSSNS